MHKLLVHGRLLRRQLRRQLVLADVGAFDEVHDFFPSVEDTMQKMQKLENSLWQKNARKPDPRWQNFMQLKQQCLYLNEAIAEAMQAEKALLKKELVETSVERQLTGLNRARKG